MQKLGQDKGFKNSGPEKLDYPEYSGAMFLNVKLNNKPDSPSYLSLGEGFACNSKEYNENEASSSDPLGLHI